MIRPRPERKSRDAKATCTRMLTGIPRKTSHEPLKIGIIGEIYVVLEPFMNLDVEITLGEMGVATHRSIYLTQWTRQNAIVSIRKDPFERVAYPYLPENDRRTWSQQHRRNHTLCKKSI
ncbi:MAG: hypothetical protein ACOX37_06725 [Bacillota bacterium]